jgi:hypothetical protein
MLELMVYVGLFVVGWCIANVLKVLGNRVVSGWVAVLAFLQE